MTAKPLTAKPLTFLAIELETIDDEIDASIASKIKADSDIHAAEKYAVRMCTESNYDLPATMVVATSNTNGKVWVFHRIHVQITAKRISTKWP